jgi:hypothetical protein
MSVIIDGTLGVTTAGAARMPAWATAGRPISPVAGDSGFNTDLGIIEWWNGTFWRSSSEQNGFTTALSGVGTAALFSPFPAAVREITVALHKSGLNGNTGILVQLGTSGGLSTTGYTGVGFRVVSAARTLSALTTGIAVDSYGAAESFVGTVVIRRVTGNTWVATVLGSAAGATVFIAGSAEITLAGELTQLAVKSGNGVQTFDEGTCNISWIF